MLFLRSMGGLGNANNVALGSGTGFNSGNGGKSLLSTSNGGGGGLADNSWRPQAQSIGGTFANPSEVFLQKPSMVAESVGGGGGGGFGIREELDEIRKAVMALEADRDNLRQAIRKLKVENSRLKLRLKRVGRAAGCLEGLDDEGRLALDMDEMDYEAVKDFILVGGPKDPLSLRYEAKIKDGQEKEHASAERYLWYKMAETFGDMEAAEAIEKAETGAKAEEAMGKIKSFDAAAWDLVKMKHWEEGQRLKLDQHKWIANLLVYSDKVYIAVSSQDKLWGTGWRKQRVEAGQPRLWDGENEGGRALMRMRDNLKESHVWADDAEKEEARRKCEELRRTFWRRPLKRDGEPMGEAFGFARGGGGGGQRGRGQGQLGRGGRGGRGRGAAGNRRSF